MTSISSVANVAKSHNIIDFQVTQATDRQLLSDTSGKHRRNTVLKELPISGDDLTEEDITLYAKQIGIDPGKETHLLWIARRGLLQPLPFPWIAVEDQIGRLYYHNCVSSVSSWEHPSDDFYRSLVRQQRLKGSNGSTTTLSMSGLTSIANLHFVDEELGFRSDGNGNSKQSDNKKDPLIDAKDGNKKELSSTNVKNNNSDEEVESVDFELEVEEALEELSSNGADDEDLVTMDVTEGGESDKKQFKEIHTIEVNISVEDKYRVDDETSAHTSHTRVSGSGDAVKDIMQTNSDDNYQSFEAKVIHKANIKQSSGVSSGVSTGGTDTKNTSQRHNEISDEFLLDENEDPFAEFDGYDKNYNDLFGSLGAGVGSGMPSKYDNSDNYDQTSAKQSANSDNNNNNNENAFHSSHNISHKPLETLLEASEERDENGLESVQEEDDEEAEEGTDSDNGIGNEGDDESNRLQIEYKFDEMARNLTEKISSLRNELRDEMRKQRNTISKGLDSKMNDIDERVKRNSDALSDAKSEVQDLKQKLNKNMTQMDSRVGPTLNASDIERLEKEMQLLRSDVRNESLDSIRELRSELNRDIKSKVNSVFGDLDIKFIDFKEEKDREMRTIRTELANVANNSKNFGQQMTELRDDLSQTLADIERQRKEHNKRLERMDSNLSEETQRFQSEVQRLQTLMKTIENKIQELDSESNEIRLLSRLETKEQNSRQCMDRIDIIDKQVRQLSERVYEAFKTVDNHSNASDTKDDKQKNVVVNRPEQSTDERDIGPTVQTKQVESRGTGAVTDESQPNEIYHRMSAMEDNIKKICDSFQRIIPDINQKKNDENWSQNRYSYMIRKPSKTKQKHKHQKHATKDTDLDNYMSRTSTSLLSSSSISDGRPNTRNAETGAGVKRHQMYKRCSHHSIPIKSHRSDIYLRGSHKCCVHRDTAEEYFSPERSYPGGMKVPVMPTTGAHHNSHWDRQQSTQQLQHIRSSSSSLLNLIKRTTKKLRDEAIELESLGNYRFVTDFEPIVSAFKDVNDVNSDEAAIKKLKSVRLDVDQKLRKLTNVINQQKSSQI